jgi:hypothetical protein
MDEAITKNKPQRADALGLSIWGAVSDGFKKGFVEETERR